LSTGAPGLIGESAADRRTTVTNFLLRRLASVVPVLLIVSVFVFLLIHLTPGDPVGYMLGPMASPAQVERMRALLGFDRPIYVQYGIWLARAVRGNLGDSIFMSIPVAEAIYQRIQPTVLLTIMAVVFEVAIGMPVGVVAAIRRNTWIDQSMMTIALLGLSIPSFWLGLELILYVGVYLHVLPVAGYVPLERSWIGAIRSLLMPAFTLGFINAALVARMTRSSMLDVLSQDFVRTALAKGLPRTRVVWHHALRNALLPVLTVVGNSFVILLGGLVITEQVFAIPGVGQLVINAVLQRDYPVIQGVLLYLVAIYVFINVMIDVIYALADPRIKYA
jgi:peptide/nickel transport system permease protein